MLIKSNHSFSKKNSKPINIDLDCFYGDRSDACYANCYQLYTRYTLHAMYMQSYFRNVRMVTHHYLLSIECKLMILIAIVLALASQMFTQIDL